MQRRNRVTLGLGMCMRICKAGRLLLASGVNFLPNLRHIVVVSPVSRLELAKESFQVVDVFGHKQKSYGEGPTSAD